MLEFPAPHVLLTVISADDYAYYVLAKYIQKQISQCMCLTLFIPIPPGAWATSEDLQVSKPGAMKPPKPPANSNGQAVVANGPFDPTGEDSDPIGTAEATATPALQEYSYPSCGDKSGQLDAALASASFSAAHTCCAIIVNLLLLPRF